MTPDHDHPQLRETVDQIIDILEGPAVAQPFGQPATRNDGLVDQVASVKATQVAQGRDISAIKDTLSNGGMRIKLPPAAWVAIAVAIIAALADVVVALSS